MIKDDDNASEVSKKHFKDTESYLKSGGKPVLGVSLKQASESLKSLSNALSTLYSKLNKGGK